MSSPKPKLVIISGDGTRDIPITKTITLRGLTNGDVGLYIGLADSPTPSEMTQVLRFVLGTSGQVTIHPVRGCQGVIANTVAITGYPQLSDDVSRED